MTSFLRLYCMFDATVLFYIYEVLVLNIQFYCNSPESFPLCVHISKCCSNTKRDSPLAEDFSSPYGYDNEPWPADIPHIPRATTTNRNLGTSIEMTEGLGDGKNHTNGLVSFHLIFTHKKILKIPSLRK